MRRRQFSQLTPRRTADVQRALFSFWLSIATTVSFSITVAPADVVGRLSVSAAGFGPVVAPARLLGAARPVAARSVWATGEVVILCHLSTHEQIAGVQACERVMLDGLDRTQRGLRVGPVLGGIVKWANEESDRVRM